jgi:hypothetical protein
MANQKYGDENPQAYCCGQCGDTINYTQQLLPLTSNVGQYPIDVTLGDNPNYSVVSTNGILT